MSRTVIVCAFDTMLDRVRMLKNYFEQKGDEVVVVMSDYSHRKKEKIEYFPEADLLVHAYPYKKNLSVQRMYSHYSLAKEMKKEIEKIEPDTIFCLIPANSLAKMMGKYKQEHPEVKLYFDVIDLWPETMPITRFSWLPPLKVWKNLRDKYLPYADRIFTECDLYQDVLDQKKNEQVQTLHWARSELPCSFADLLSDEEIHFVYLGSINNIIDIDFIVDFLKRCSQYKPATLHIIGEGESKHILIQRLENADINVVDHQTVFEQEKKQAIFDQCNFAFNIMKESVVVGLTMKSLDYLCGGVPLINNIPADTARLVDEYHIGLNVNRENMEQVAKEACSMPLEKQYEMRENCRKVYKEYFRNEKFEDTLKQFGI